MLYATIAKAGRYAPVIRAACKAEAMDLMAEFMNSMRAKGMLCSIMLSEKTMPDNMPQDDGKNYASIDNSMADYLAYQASIRNSNAAIEKDNDETAKAATHKAAAEWNKLFLSL
jgi:DNA-binding ferritin-like protein